MGSHSSRIQHTHRSHYIICIMLIFKWLWVFAYYTPFKNCYLISNRPVCTIRLNHIKWVKCWASVVDGGPTLNQHWVNVSCLLWMPGVNEPTFRPTWVGDRRLESCCFSDWSWTLSVGNPSRRTIQTNFGSPQHGPLVTHRLNIGLHR